MGSSYVQKEQKIYQPKGKWENQWTENDWFFWTFMKPHERESFKSEKEDEEEFWLQQIFHPDLNLCSCSMWRDSVISRNGVNFWVLL